MSALLLPSRGYTSQPQGPSQIDRSNTLSVGLVEWVSPSAAATAIRSKPVLKSSGTTCKPSSAGLAFQGSAANAQVDFGASGGLRSVVGDTHFTIATRIYVSDTSSDQRFVMDGASNGANTCLMARITAGIWEINLMVDAINTNLTGGTVTVGWHDVVLINNFNTNWRLIVDGVTVITYNYSAKTALTLGVGLRLMANGLYTPALGFRGQMVYAAFWNRALSAAEEKAVRSNPWQIFKAPGKYIDIQPRQFFSPLESRKIETTTGVLAKVAPALLSRATRTAQPQGPVGVDWGNPLTRGLCFLVSGLDGSLDLVSGTRATSAKSKSVTAKGVGVAATSGSSPLQWGHAPIVGSTGSGTGDVTLMAFSDTASAGSAGATLIGQMMSGSPFSQVQLMVNFSGQAGVSTNGVATIEAYSGAARGYADTDSSGVDGLMHCYAGIKYGSGTAHKIFIDGVSKTAATGSSGNFGIAASSRIAVGGEAYSTSRSVIASIPFAAAWNRALSDAEIKSISNNPWQIFAPQQRNIWVPYP